MSTADSINSQKEIFGKVQGLMAFLDTTDQTKNRENTEEWKRTLESLREITNNPLPFLLELLKLLKASKAAKKVGAKAKAFKAAREKNRKGKKSDDDFKTTKKSWKEKFNLDGNANAWVRTLNAIIRQSVLNVIPRIDDILYEEIIKAFNCDLSMHVPVVGDGLNAPIQIDIADVDLLKQLFNDPASDVGKYMYESAQLNNAPGVYPPGQTPYPVNRFLRDIIFNNGNLVSSAPGNKQTIYGASGRALFDIQAAGGVFLIWPYYKIEAPVNPGYKTAPTAAVPGAQKFTFIEFLKDYFGNIRLIEMQQLLAALLEILTGFMSVRNKSFSIVDLLGLQKFFASINKMLEECEGGDLPGPNTDSVSHLAELYDDDSYFEFNVEEERNITLEVTRKSKNVLTLQSCDMLDIPIDNAMIDAAVDEILAPGQVIDKQLEAFDLVLQQVASRSANEVNYDIGLGNISLPVEIDFKENLIKKLPQILIYCILNPKGVLPVVLTAKLINQNAQTASSLDVWAKIFKRVIRRVVKEILNEVVKYIFALIKDRILRLIRDMIKRKLSEMNKKKIRIIRKLLDILLPLIIALQEAKSCKEIFDILLAALLANMPDIPFSVPPFLVAAAKLRPGTSTLGAFEKYLGKLQSLGIKISDMPDGSPNQYIQSGFSLIEAYDQERQDNEKNLGTIVTGQVIHPLGPGLIKPFTTTEGFSA